MKLAENSWIKEVRLVKTFTSKREKVGSMNGEHNGERFVSVARVYATAMPTIKQNKIIKLLSTNLVDLNLESKGYFITMNLERVRKHRQCGIKRVKEVMKKKLKAHNVLFFHLSLLRKNSFP